MLFNFSQLAEEYCYSDSNSCLMKLGMIGETIVNLMFTYDRIPLPADNTDTIYREGLLTQDLVDILHALRKVRNKAVHKNYASVADGKALLPMVHSLCEWFMQTYGDWNYQHHEFVMPAPQQAKTVDKAAEEHTETRLAQESEEKLHRRKLFSKTPTASGPARQPVSAKGLRLRRGSSLTSNSDRWAGRPIPRICVSPRELIPSRAVILRLSNGQLIPPWEIMVALTMPFLLACSLSVPLRQRQNTRTSPP